VAACSLEYNFQYFVNNGTTLTQYGKISNTSNLYVCVNTTVSSTYYIDYAEVVYYTLSGGYETRHNYLYKNSTLTAIIENKTLYTNQNLETFTFTVQDVSLNPYVNYYLNLLRWYPELNSYQLVEMGKTDDNGKTILKVKEQDIDYRLGVYDQYGRLIELKNPTRFDCSVAPCAYEVTIIGNQDFTETLNIQTSLTFNRTTNIFTLIYNDPSGHTDLINLTVYKQNPLEDTIVCTSSAVINTGVLTCDISGNTGSFKAVVFRTASPKEPILISFIDIVGAALQIDDSLKLFAGFLILAVLGLIGAYIGPTASLVLVCFGAVSLIFFSILNWYIAGGIVALGLTIYTILKKVT
jgi:hypothetical protein